MEHLGDAVAGRYVLVAPQPARAARRQYHAVDMLADRTVTVRFEPLTPADLHGMARLKTKDGRRVLDGGTFEGSYFVVVDNERPRARPTPVDATVAELEAMYAEPWLGDPPTVVPDPPESRAVGAVAVVRNAVVSMLEIAGGVAIVVLLVAAAYLALGGVPSRDPVRTPAAGREVPAAPAPPAADAEPAPAPPVPGS